MVENNFILNENTGIFLRVPVGKPTKHFGEANGSLRGMMDSHGGNDGFPWWERWIPMVGTACPNRAEHPKAITFH